ncbi:MAG: cell division ATP-binding protein FtsE [Lachnospiraceae bacterium]|nr:cell division ATP-binding protein FtsE [Lachnospiraceae bacterium]
MSIPEISKLIEEAIENETGDINSGEENFNNYETTQEENFAAKADNHEITQEENSAAKADNHEITQEDNSAPKADGYEIIQKANSVQQPDSNENIQEENSAEQLNNTQESGISSSSDSSENELQIKFEDVGYRYSNGSEALKKISLEINKGEFVFVVGHSGSGKSTLIRTLLGELKPTKGVITVGGKDLSKIKQKKLPFYRRKLGVVFQEFKLLEDRSVFDNVEIAQRVIGVKKDKRIKNCMEMIKLVGLENEVKKKTRDLSGGEQQRVAIARAMVNKPDILLADEPTGNLDPQNSLEIMKLLEELNEFGTTVLVVTHNDKLVDSMKKRVITLKDGNILSDKQGGYL